MWKLQNTLKKNSESKINRWEIRKYFKANRNDNMTYQNLCSAVKAVLRGIFIAISTYIKKKRRSQINITTLCMKKWEKVEQTKTQTKQKQENSKDRSGDLQNREGKTIERINKTNIDSFKILTKLTNI